MSYSGILNEIETKIIDGPYCAFGMKKPGSKYGVWLFGEKHSHQTSDKNHNIPERVITRRYILC
ncbi:MAG: hypothetical protein ABJI93_01585 [Nonlabens ulvanivorans]|uniref:hypothetical protein n=1 Tax=Nonlabens ulvanivorans TaxID=906888 RepID=UPI003298FFEE